MIKKQFSIVYLINFHKLLLLFLTLRVHWIENEEETKNRVPYTPTNEFEKFYIYIPNTQHYHINKSLSPLLAL